MGSSRGPCDGPDAGAPCTDTAASSTARPQIRAVRRELATAHGLSLRAARNRSPSPPRIPWSARRPATEGRRNARADHVRRVVRPVMSLFRLRAPRRARRRPRGGAQRPSTRSDATKIATGDTARRASESRPRAAPVRERRRRTDRPDPTNLPPTANRVSDPPDAAGALSTRERARRSRDRPDPTPAGTRALAGPGPVARRTLTMLKLGARRSADYDPRIDKHLSSPRMMTRGARGRSAPYFSATGGFLPATRTARSAYHQPRRLSRLRGVYRGSVWLRAEGDSELLNAFRRTARGPGAKTSRSSSSGSRRSRE